METNFLANPHPSAPKAYSARTRSPLTPGEERAWDCFVAPPVCAVPANPETVPQAPAPTLPSVGASAAEVIYRNTITGASTTPISIPTTQDHHVLTGFEPEFARFTHVSYTWEGDVGHKNDPADLE